MKRSIITALALLSLLLAACASAGSAQLSGQAGEQPVAEASEASAADGSNQSSNRDATGAGEAPSYAAPAEQRIIKTGEMSLEVQNVASTLASVRRIAAEIGGYIGGSQAGTLEQSATLTLRIPASRFDEALSRLRELGETVVEESTREQDVTSQVVDLEARISNLEASEASYRALAERAERVEDVLAVQSRLDQVRGEIEQLRAQLENVSDQADLSTLTVTLIPRAAPVQAQAEGWDPGARLAEAVAALVGVGQGVLNVLIWIAIVLLPILVVFGLLVVVGLRVATEIRRRLPSPGPIEPS
ncbi:MAG: DUF4349 domain-containing protein [Chloroflexota bacterium]